MFGSACALGRLKSVGRGKLSDNASVRKWVRRVLAAAALLLVAGIAVVAVRGRRPASTAAAYFAKMTCSGVFLSERDPASVRNGELALDIPLTRLINVDVDRQQGVVTASVAGLVKRRALYRPGLGCTLDSEVSVAELKRQSGSLPTPAAAAEPWKEVGAENLVRDRLNAALDDAFTEPEPTHPRRTRAVVVVRDGALVAERYAPGFSREMRLQGWSMGKSLTNALVGILVRQGKLDMHAPPPVPEWSAPGDPRHAITLDQLMRMSSGLEFLESYGDLESDVTVMLFRKASAGGYAAAKPLIRAPDAAWEYSSGTANIISRIVRNAVGGTLGDYWTFPQRELFDRIGMSSAILEPDASGTFVGSSFCYATAHDWARLGLLFLNDGVAHGERILPAGWVRYSTTPTAKAPDGQYGALIWLNAGDGADPQKRPWPSAPRDTFAFQGFEGQHVFVVPSRRLVVVRLGLSQSGSTWNAGQFIGAVAAAFPETH
jgi:CubicO group peptidase (beta-lactamase class C family)